MDFNCQIFNLVKLIHDRCLCIKEDFNALEDAVDLSSVVDNHHYIDLQLCSADIDILVNFILQMED